MGLPAQPFQILLTLLVCPGDLVTREQLRDDLWSEGTFVDFEGSLNAAMNKLRRALNDSAENPRYIETVPRHGYRFIAPVIESANIHLPEPASDLLGEQRDVAPATLPFSPIPTRPARHRAVISALLALLILAVVGLVTYGLHATPKLTERDTIVLADFVNKTGDPVFDGTLYQGLTVQLEQSPFLRLVSQPRIRQTLRLMGHRPIRA